MEQQVRIVLTGASGVGKTSLASLLGEALGIEVIPELARIVCQDLGFANPTEIPDQQVFRLQVLAEQIKRENALDSFVADRGTIDAWVMWQRWQMSTAMTYDTEAYYDQCRNQAVKRYTHIVYIPPLFTPAEDEFRWTEPDYIKQVDRITRMTLYDWELWDRTYTIRTNQPSERVAEVKAWLGL
jgi:predicted ATPase